MKWLLHLLFAVLVLQGPWAPWLEWVAVGLIFMIVLFVFNEATLRPHRARLDAVMRKSAQQQAEWEASQRHWAELQKKLDQP